MDSTLPTAERSHTYQLIELKLIDAGHGSLREFAENQRTMGVSWRRMSNRIRDITGVETTENTLWRWFQDDSRVAHAAPTK